MKIRPQKQAHIKDIIFDYDLVEDTRARFLRGDTGQEVVDWLKAHPKLKGMDIYYPRDMSPLRQSIGCKSTHGGARKGRGQSPFMAVRNNGTILQRSTLK